MLRNLKGRCLWFSYLVVWSEANGACPRYRVLHLVTPGQNKSSHWLFGGAICANGSSQLCWLCLGRCTPYSWFFLRKFFQKSESMRITVIMRMLTILSAMFVGKITHQR